MAVGELKNGHSGVTETQSHFPQSHYSHNLNIFFWQVIKKIDHLEYFVHKDCLFCMEREKNNNYSLQNLRELNIYEIRNISNYKQIKVSKYVSMQAQG